MAMADLVSRTKTRTDHSKHFVAAGWKLIGSVSIYWALLVMEIALLFCDPVSQDNITQSYSSGATRLGKDLKQARLSKATLEFQVKFVPSIV